MYSTGMKRHIVENSSFKTCLQLLKFLSKDDLLEKFDKVNVVYFFILVFNSTLIDCQK